MIVAIVSGINPQLGESLRKVLDNMNVKITAKLFDSNGNQLASDTVEVIVTKSVIASVAPTGVHITNKKAVPSTVAVGTTVQLYGACTPVRLHQGIKWTVGKNAFDNESSKHATVTSDGLVTFTSAGTVTVRVNPESTLYGTFSDTVAFTVVEQADLPVEDFVIAGETNVDEGETTQLTIDNLRPAGAYTGNVVWTSADPGVAMVDQNGVVTGLDGGSGVTYSKTTTITANIDGVERSVSVKVSRKVIGSTISSVEISGDSAVAIGNSFTYTANVFPSRLNTNKDVVRKWGYIDAVSGEKIYANGSEANNGIAKINDSGVLTGLSSGTIEIFVDAEYNGTVVTDTFSVTVGNAITDFAISGKLSVEEGETSQLSITSITPEDYDPALLETVVWTVEDPSIAYVDENGVVKGLDGGAVKVIRADTKTTTVTATIAGVSKSVQITVSSTRLNTYTGGYIDGPEAVVVDFPHAYTSVHSPARVDTSRQYWGITYDDGQAPWGSTNNNSFVTSFNGNTENSYASVDSKTALVTGKKAGTTEIWTYMARNLTSHQNLSRKINIVEIVPKSITVTAPAKYEYLEGDTELDLTGMEVKLTYDREALAQYYPDASSYTDEQLTVTVSDYTVSEINPVLLDNEQYIVVTVTRAGKDMRAIFPILVKSKQVDTIEITNAPRYRYLEGETELDLSGLKVTANYLNAASEEVTDYTVNTGDFNPEILNVEQNITVTYSHAGRSASATFPVIVYGVPVVSVSTGGYEGGWTNGKVTFTLDSTHKVDGITYYFKTGENGAWVSVGGNELTVDTDIEDTFYFKAINGIGIESAETIGYKVSIDNVTPVFTLTPEVTELTNQPYDVVIGVGTVGASGIASVILDGEDITGTDRFTVTENGTYTVKVTSVSGLSGEQQIVIENIDTQAPAILGIKLEQKNIGGFARFMNTLTFGLFFKESIEATITAEDYGVAGIDRIEYRYLDENGEPIGDWAVYNDNKKPTQDPDFKEYMEARAVDKATNISDSFYSDGYVIDGTAPTDVKVTATTDDGLYISDSWTSKDVTLKLSSTAFSDIYKYYYRIDGGEWVEMDGDTLAVSTHGIENYEFKAVSYADNESAVTPYIVKIDKTAPIIRVDFEGTFGRWTSGDVKFAFSLLNESISGVTYYYDNGNGWTEIVSGDEILLTENVNASYVFKAVNGAGVESTPSDSYRVMIDNVEPSVKFTPEVTGETTEPYGVAFNVTCGEAGLKSVSVNGEDVTGSGKITVSENGKYIFVLTGNNGLTATAVYTVDNFISFEIKVNSISFAGKESGSFANYYNEPFGKYFGENVEISVDAFATEGAVGKIEYRTVSENGDVSEWLAYDEMSKPEIAPNFKGYVEARAYDTAGTRVSEVVRSEGITVDGIAPTAPVVEATVNGEPYTGSWTGEKIEVKLKSDAYSGIKEYYYSIDGGEFIKIAGDSIILSDAGEHTYAFKAVSKAGLDSVVTNFGAKIELSKPAVSVGVDGTLGHKTPDDVVFTLSSPNTISGVTYYYNNGNGWNEMDGEVLTVNYNCDTTYVFKAINGAGVESYQSPAYRVILDKDYALVEQKPIINVSVSGTTDTFTNGDVTFKLSVSEADGDVTYYYNDGNGWTGMSGDSLTVNNDGNAVYKFKAIDSKGRESLESAEYKVMRDSVAPTVSVTLNNNEFTNSELTAAVTATAGISGIASVSVNGEDITDAMQFSVTENGKYTVTVTANNGLTAQTVLEVTSFDYDAPEISDIALNHKNTGGFARFINTITFGLFFNEKTEITVTAKDTGVSGLKAIEYRLLDENAQAISEWTVYDENDKPCVDTEFRGYIETRAVDNAGNVSETVTSKGFTVDLTNPEGMSITATVNGEEYDGNYTAEEIVLTPSATAFSEIQYYMYSEDNGEWNIMTGESIKASDGIHTYSFKAVSNADLESEVAVITTKREKGTPELQVVVTGKTDEWTQNDVVFTLNATNGKSGMKYYYDNGSGWTEMNGNVLAVTDNINAEYKFKCVNGANTESLVSDNFVVMLDKKAPENFKVNAKSNGKEIAVGSIITDDAVIDVSAEAFSDIEKYQYSLNGGEWIDMTDSTLRVSEDETYIYKFRAVSKSGAVSDESFVAFTLDRDYNPNANVNNNTNANTNNNTNTNSGGKPSQVQNSPSIPKTDGVILAVAAPAAVSLAGLVFFMKSKKKDGNEE